MGEWERVQLVGEIDEYTRGSFYRAPRVSSGLKSAGVRRAPPGEVVVPVEMFPVDSCVCNEPLAHEFVC